MRGPAVAEAVEVAAGKLAVFGLRGRDPVGAWIARVAVYAALGDFLASRGIGEGTVWGAGTWDVEGTRDEVEDA